ncbi:MAG: hypothetical protein JSV86_02640 [Gemmatimonadota bacterium]|nr:MAG: hypothetical protein JSV86_02640 [Gemmatimonadota bacterium]
MHRWSFVPLALLVASCAGSTEPGDISVSVDTEFRLSLGQSALVEGAELWIEFRAVPADSRCPPWAYCFWAGDAEVELVVWEAGSLKWKRRDVELHTNPSVGPLVVTFGVYAVQLVGLEPGFRAEGNREYVVTLRVLRRSLQPGGSDSSQVAV